MWWRRSNHQEKHGEALQRYANLALVKKQEKCTTTRRRLTRKKKPGLLRRPRKFFNEPSSCTMSKETQHLPAQPKQGRRTKKSRRGSVFGKRCAMLLVRCSVCAWQLWWNLPSGASCRNADFASDVKVRGKEEQRTLQTLKPGHADRLCTGSSSPCWPIRDYAIKSV